MKRKVGEQQVDKMHPGSGLPPTVQYKICRIYNEQQHEKGNENNRRE